MTIHRPMILGSVIAALLAGTAVAAPDPFVAGNAAASAGDHVGAAAAFEHAIELHGWSPGALFDLGNAYASSGRLGPAILAYERAHLLAPRDRAIDANLAHAREAAGVTAPATSWIHAALATLGSDEWTWLAIAAAFLACAGAVGLAWSSRSRIARTLAVIGTLVGAFAITAATVVAPAADEAIVVHGEAARIAPTTAAEAAFTAPEGDSVRIEQHRGEFVYVRDGDRTGWLPKTAVERVIVTERPARHA